MHLIKRTKNGVKKVTRWKVVRDCASQGGWGPLNQSIQSPQGDQLRHSNTPLRALRGTVADSKNIIMLSRNYFAYTKTSAVGSLFVLKHMGGPTVEH